MYSWKLTVAFLVAFFFFSGARALRCLWKSTFPFRCLWKGTFPLRCLWKSTFPLRWTLWSFSVRSRALCVILVLWFILQFKMLSWNKKFDDRTRVMLESTLSSCSLTHGKDHSVLCPLCLWLNFRGISEMPRCLAPRGLFLPLFCHRHIQIKQFKAACKGSILKCFLCKGGACQGKFYHPGMAIWKDASILQRYYYRITIKFLCFGSSFTNIYKGEFSGVMCLIINHY